MARRGVKSPRMVGVWWVDAAMDEDSETAHELTTANAVTFGLIIAIEADYIRIASEVFDDGGVRNVKAIPKGMIRAITAVPFEMPEPLRGWRAAPEEV